MLLDLPSGRISVDNVQDAVSHIASTISEAPNIGAPTAEERRLGARLHALIIGINEYERRPLRGAVADADAMHAYLRTKLDVPEHQIKNLRDGEATRDAIIQELVALRTRQTVRMNEAILIYFAGYGASLWPPRVFGWNIRPGEKIRAIVPFDSLYNDRNRCVPPIVDRTVAVLISDLAEAKGDKITLIFDCCYSGPATHADGSTLLKRGLDPEEFDALHPMLDQNIVRNRFEVRGYMGVKPGFIPEDNRTVTHLFLSAHREADSAYEDVVNDGGEVAVRGEFTRALLDVLYDVDTDRATYRQVEQRIKNGSNLTPQCEGHHDTRRLFSFKEPVGGRAVFEIDHIDGGYILGAGAAQGVTDGAEFAVYSSPDFRDGHVPVARVIATNIRASSADLVFAPSSPVSALALNTTSSYFASPTRVGSSGGLYLHVALSQDLVPVMHALALERIRNDTQSPEIQLVDKAEANLDVCVTRSGHIEYLIRDRLIQSHGLAKLNGSTPPTADYIQPVLAAASKFFWHLHRSPATHQRLDDEDFHIEMHQIEPDGWNPSTFEETFKRAGGDLVRSGVVDIEVDSAIMYGFTVHNRSKQPLFVWVFYFDCSNLSISEYYNPHFAAGERILTGDLVVLGNATPPENRPFTFYLPPGLELDVGLVKFFISTEDVDLSWIAQDSPLKAQGTRSGAFVPVQSSIANEQAGKWGISLIAVVQRSSSGGR